MSHQEPIHYSSLESELFGLKTGRISLNEWNPTDLLKQIHSDRYDLVRLRLPSTDSQMELKLNQLGMPYALSGVVQRFAITKNDFDVKPYLNSNIVFEDYSERWKDPVSQILFYCFNDQSLGFFDIPYFHARVPKKTQTEAFCQFFLDRISHPESGYRGWVIRVEGQFAGILINTVEATYTETVLAALLPEFRNKQVSRDLARCSQNFGRIRGDSVGYTGARIQNILSQRLSLSEGMVPHESHMIYCLLPFFGLQHSPESPQVPFASPSQDPLVDLATHLRQRHPELKIRSLRISPHLQTVPAEFTFQLLPENSQSLLGIAGFKDSAGGLCASAWIDLNR